MIDGSISEWLDNSHLSEALAKPLGNEGRHGPVELRGVVFLTESIVASVL